MENKLQVIVKESGIEPTKAKFILENFQKSFELADTWEQKAKAIVVTNENQKDDMKIARIGRLALREERIRIEKSRKDLKEQALREGKAIDGIANVLKALIVPIEEYLEKQEKFVEIREAAKQEAKRLEVEARIAEEERIAQEKAAQEQERLRIENEKLKREAEEKEKAMAEERKKQEATLAKERAKAETEKKQQEKLLSEQKAKAEAERKIAEEKVQKEREEQQKKLALERAKIEAERKEKERLEELLKNHITCPKCGHKFQQKAEG